MTQQPFSRPGAIDLSGLKRPAQPPPGAGPTGGAGATGARGGRVGVRRRRRRAELPGPARGLDDRARRAGLLLHLAGARERHDGAPTWRPSRASTTAGSSPASIDIDASPAIAQAMQIPQVPMLFVLLDGRPATQPIPGLIPLDELRTLFNQLGQQLTAQGITGRHQPRPTVPAAGRRSDDPEEPLVDPRYAAAQDALGEGNIDLAVAEYQKLVDGNPADAEAAAGLAMAKVLQRTQGVDLNAARAAAAADPDDVDAQTHGRRPRHARRPRGRRVHPADRRGAPYLRRRPQQGPRAPARPVRAPSATTTPASARPARASPPRCSERRRVRGCTVRLSDQRRVLERMRSWHEDRVLAALTASNQRPARSGPPPTARPGPGTASRRRSRARPSSKKWIEAGSPPCSPQTPSLRLALTSRPDSLAVRTRAPDALGVERLERRDREDRPARGRSRRTTPRRRRGRSPTSSGSGRWCRRRRSRPTRRSCPRSARRGAARSWCRSGAGSRCPAPPAPAVAMSWIRPRTMSSSRTEATSGIMISGSAPAAGLEAGRRGLEDRPGLHGEQVRDGDAEAYAAQAEHRVLLVQPLDGGEQLAVAASCAGRASRRWPARPTAR